MNTQEKKRIGFLLERTTRIAKLSFTKAFKNLGVDITPEQWIIIDILQSNDRLSQKEIGQRSFKNAPTISRIIDNLVNKDLVTRIGEKGDRRKTAISLTDNGKNLIAKCQTEVNNVRTISWQHLDDNDYEQFTRVLDQIFDNFNGY